MATGAGHVPWRVLVVDDEENLNWSLVNSLQKEGYATEGAHTGEDAVRLLSTTSYDCVISDVKMPGMDGFELLQWLRQRRSQTRVIMMTAFGSPTAQQEAMRNGVIAYLEKPFDLRALKDELRRLANESAAVPGAEADGYDLLEVARVLNLSRRDIALSVQGGGYRGMLRFLRGELMWAEAGPLRGEAAFMALCGPRGGRAQPEAWDGRTDRNVTAPVSRLIYQALSQREGRPIGISGALNLAHGTSSFEQPGTPRMTPAPAASQGGQPPAQPNPQHTENNEPERRDSAPGPAANTLEPGIATTQDSTHNSTDDSEHSAPHVHTTPASSPDETLTGSTATPREADGARITDQPSTHVGVLRALTASLPAPCGVAVLRLDGALLGQSWNGMAEITSSAYTHLASAAQAASRALLLGDLGVIDDVRICTADRRLVIRRVSRGDRAALLVAILPRDADVNVAAELLRTRTPEVLEALR